MAFKKISGQVLSIVLMVYITGVYTKGNCPDAVKLKPCHCYEEETPYLACDGKVIKDIKTMFQNMSKQLNDQDKLFGSLQIDDLAMDELPANVFDDIKFKSLFMSRFDQVKHINPLAFAGTEGLITAVTLKTVDITDSKVIYNIINALPNLTTIEFKRVNIKSISDNAFKSHQNLRSIKISDGNIGRVGANAFRQLGNALRFLDISDTTITQIADNGFAFDGNSTQNLRLILNSVTFSTEDLSKDAFAGGSRGVSLSIINSKHLSYLNESTFGTFLDQNLSNEVITHIDCSECHNKWLLKFGREVNGIYCTNDLPLNDPRNFVGC